MPSEQGAIENPDLERAMNEVAKNDTPQARESLYRAILASTLIVAGGVSGGSSFVDGTGVASAGTSINFRTLEHPPGNVILPAFTNLDALISFAGSEIEWAGLSAQALFQSILPGNIAEVRLNPFRPDQQARRRNHTPRIHRACPGTSAARRGLG